MDYSRWGFWVWTLLILAILAVTITCLVRTLSLSSSTDAHEKTRLVGLNKLEEYIKHHTGKDGQGQRLTEDYVKSLTEDYVKRLTEEIKTLQDSLEQRASERRLIQGSLETESLAQFTGNPVTRDGWVARKAAATPPGARVLDVSSGNQPYRPLFAHCRYQGHEFEGNQQIVDEFRGEQSKDSNMHNKYAFIGDVTDTGAPSDTFDVVLLTEVLEHVPEPVLAIQELVRVTKPGGRILVTAPFTSGSHQKPFHFSAGYSREWYAYVAAKFGLTVVDTQSQGDYFKVMAQEIFRVTSLPTSTSVANSEAIMLMRETVYAYLTKMSARYGDFSPEKLEVADDFTIGWMVEFVKPSVQ